VDGKIEFARYRTPTPQQKIFYLSSQKIQLGKNLWRVRPGKINDEIGLSHLWSPYYEFYFYPTLLDKLKEEKKVLIGFPPIPVAQIQQVDENGDLIGFNIDLAKWLTKKLGENLNVEIKPIFKEIAWKDIFLKISERDIDLAVGIFSASDKRESTYNLRFSTGYLIIHQVFITKSNKQDFPKALKNSNIGTTHTSINRKVGEYLEDRFDYQIVPKYNDYADLYFGIENGEVDFGIVDNILVQKYLGTRFFQYGPYLDEYLTKFYKQSLGRNQEEYAVMLPGKGYENERVLSIINQIIKSPEGQEYISNLKEKWLILTTKSEDI
jgi:ABC-type amino acid transport substrate-binding protein